MKTDAHGRRHPHKRSESGNCAGGLELLREANAQLDRFFATFSGLNAPGSIGELQSLLRLHDVLEQITPLLRTRELQASGDARVHGELAAYARNLLRLRSELAAAQAAADMSAATPLAASKPKPSFASPNSAASYDC